MAVIKPVVGPGNHSDRIAELPVEQWKEEIEKCPVSMQSTVRVLLKREYNERRRPKPSYSLTPGRIGR